MKKILLIALTVTAVLIFVQLYKFTVLGELGYSALYMPNDKFVGLLTGERDDETLRVIKPERFGPFDLLYERAGDLYAGDAKTKLNRAFPLFANDGAALMSIGDGIKLITEDFERLDAYYGLLISDGRSFNSDMTPADPYDFILVRMKDNVFGNVVPMTLTEGSRVTRIPLNSLLYHTPESVRWYAYEDGNFVLHGIDGLGENSVVTFEGQSMGYHEYLLRLGLMPDIRSLPDSPDIVFELAALLPENSDHAREGGRAGLGIPPSWPDAADEPEVGGVSEGADLPEPPSPPNPPKPAKPPERGEVAPQEEGYKPVVSLSKFGGDFSAPPYRNDYRAEARLRIYDPNGALTDAVRVYLTLTVGEKVYTQRWYTRNFEDADIGYIYRTVSFGDLEWGATYEIYGEYQWRDEEGVIHTERFGEQKLKIEAKDVPETPAVTPPENPYAKPGAAVSDVIADVYGIYGSLVITDPGSRMTGGVRFEVKRDGKTYRRTYFTASGAFRIEPLPPGTAYELNAFITYRDERGASVTESCMDALSISTLPVSDISPLTLHWQPGDVLYANKLSVKDLYLDQDESKGLTPRGVNVSPYIGRIVMISEGKESSLADADKKNAIAGIPASHTTPALYESYKDHDFEIKVLDIFQNELPLDPLVAGVLLTCKATPLVTARLSVNAVADVKLDLTFKDADAAAEDPPNIRVRLYRESVTAGVVELVPVVGTLLRSDGSTETSDEYAVLQDGSGLESLVFTDLPLGKAYAAVFTGDYNLEDGAGAVNGEIGRLRFTTVTRAGLGSLVLNAPQADVHVSASAVSAGFLINKDSTREVLRLLLDEVTVTARPAGDSDPANARAVILSAAENGADFAEWTTSGGALTALFPDLKSMTEYELAYTANALIGDETYDVPVISNFMSFKTMKRPASVLIGGLPIEDSPEDPAPAAPFDRTPAPGSFFVTSTTVDLFDVSVYDPDGTISGGVSMIVMNQYGSTVFARALTPTANPDTGAVTVPVGNLSSEMKYTVVFTAREYNEGYDLSSQSYNKELDHFGLETKLGISGNVQMRQLKTSQDLSRAYDATFIVKLEDIRREIVDEDGNGKYFLRLKRLGDDNPAVTTMEFEWTGWTESNKQLETDITDFKGLLAFYDYELELFVKIGAFEKVLDSVSFDTQGEIQPIASMYDFIRFRNDANTAWDSSRMKGRYVVVEDLVWNRNSSNPDERLAGQQSLSQIGNNSDYFSGSLDFQGHSLTMHWGNGGTSLFFDVVSPFELKNVVLNLYLDQTLGVNEVQALVRQNQGGTIRDVRVNVYGGGSESILWNRNFSFITRYNMGLIENFAIRLMDPLYCRDAVGLVSYGNSGTIRNGYVYGEPIVVPEPAGMSEKSTSQNIGGIVYANYRNGLTENVYSLVDIEIDTEAVTPTANTIGTIAAYNQGVLRNAYSAGQVYFSDYISGSVPDTASGKYVIYGSGPGVGNQSEKEQTAVYYYSGDDEATGVYTQAYNTRVMSETLRREEWHANVLGSGFDSANTVPIGYYPHVKTSGVMPPQDYIPLPGSTASEIEIVSAIVEKQREEYAIVALTLKNPEYKTIRGFTVANMGSALVLGPRVTQAELDALGLGLTLEGLGDRTQIDGDGLSRVFVLLSKPEKYFSRYLITQLTEGAIASPTLHPVPNGGFPVDAEFFYPIDDMSDWALLAAEAGPAATKPAAGQQNYRLKADLDFNNVLASNIRVGTMVPGRLPTASTDVFAGKLDGGVYDDEMELIDVHKLENIVLNVPMDGSLSAAQKIQGGGVFAFVTGTISNLLVEDIEIIAPENYYVGFVRVLYGGGLIENVRLANIKYEGPTDQGTNDCFIGGLVAAQYYGDVKDSSVYGAVITASAKSTAAGGLTGELYAADMRNCWVAGLDMNAGGLMGRGVGGVVGRTDAAKLYNLYAQGRIETSAQSAGGIVGMHTAATPLQNLWSKVDISSATDRLGGVAGAVFGNAADISPLNALALGNLSGAAARFDGTAAGDDMHRLFGDGILFDSPNGEASLFGGFASETQRINGAVPLVPNTSEIISDDATLLHIGTGADPADAYDLKNSRTYTHNIHMGAAFDYGTVKTGILPRLYSASSGKLLEGQPLIPMGGADAEILRVDTNGDDFARVFVQYAEGDPGLITAMNIEYWDAAAYDISVERDLSSNYGYDSPDGMCVYRIDVNFTGDPERCLDTYAIRSILIDGSAVPVTGEINFMITRYWTISSAADWQSLMGAHGQSFENFRVTGNVNFNGISGVVSNVSVNRLEGPENAPYPVISWYTKTGADANLIQNVTAELSGLCFEDITITPNYNIAGVVGKLQGRAENLTFRRVTVTGASRTYLGCVANMSAHAENILLENVTVSGSTYSGGLAGLGDMSEFKNISLKEVSVSGQTYTGGLTGRSNGGRFDDITAESIFVNGGSGTYAGGIAGYAPPLIGSSNIWVNQNITVKDAVVIGNIRVGGIFGYGQMNNDGGKISRVKNAFIRASGDNAGGLLGGVAAWYNIRAELTDSYVFGTNNVGGYMGDSSRINQFHMTNSVVSTINYTGYDGDTGYTAWLARFKARNDGNDFLKNAAFDKIPLISTVNTIYKNIGGVQSGSRSQEGVVIAHSFIGGEADYVGGVMGGFAASNGDYVLSAAVIGSTIVGKRYVGGITGRFSRGGIQASLVNANVIGEDEVGGLVGRMGQDYALTGGSTPYIRGSYFIGNVTATGDGAGLVGFVNEPMITTGSLRSYSNLVAATVNAGNAAFFYNRPDAVPLDNTHYVFGGSKLNSVGPTVGANDVTIEHVYNNADLKDYTKWRAIGSSFGTTGSGRAFYYGGLKATTEWYAADNYMPYMSAYQTEGNGNVLALYQFGRVDNNDGTYTYTYNARPGVTNDTKGTLLEAPLGGIPIPEDGAAVMPLMRAMALTPQVLPRASVYAAGGASGLNIEFDAANPETYFVVKAAGLTLIEEPIEARVYTLDYDFVTPLTVEVTDGHTTETYDVEPYSLRRSVMLYEDDYYYTDGLGLRAGSGALLPGGFINLRDGRGLTADGLLYDAATGDPLGTIAVPASLRKEASPLNAFTYGDYRIEAYLNFSVTAADGGKGGVTTKRLLGANGSMTAADPDVSAVYDSLIYDARDGEEYLSVLDAYGRIADTRAAIKKPEDFKNAGIAHFANNLNSELPYMLVRYENGLIDGFNYLTGEPLAFESKGDLSLLEYAEDYFSSDNIEPLSEAARGYMNLKPLQRALSVFGLKELLSGIEDEAARISEEEDGDANGNGSGDAPGGADERTELKPGTDEPAPEEAGTPVTPLGDVRADGSGRAVNATGLGNGTATAVGAGAGDRLGDGGAGTPDPAATGPDADGFANIAAETGTEDADADEEIPDTNDGANETGAELGTEPGDTEAEAAESATINGAAANIAQGANANRGGTQALAVPERPERRSYTLVYDAAAGKYVFCDTESLLETGRIEPVLTATAEAETAALAMLAEAEAREIAPENPLLGGGMKVLIALFVVSFLLLYAGALRQRRSSR